MILEKGCYALVARMAKFAAQLRFAPSLDVNAPRRAIADEEKSGRIIEVEAFESWAVALERPDKFNVATSLHQYAHRRVGVHCRQRSPDLFRTQHNVDVDARVWRDATLASPNQ
jgi:hypothetical protein